MAFEDACWWGRKYWQQRVGFRPRYQTSPVNSATMMAATPVSPVPVAPAGLTRRAKSFVESEGIRVARQDIGRHRDAWSEHGVPAAEIDRAVAFEDRWGGLALPPAPFYESGPRILGADVPDGSAAEAGSRPGTADIPWPTHS